MNSSGIKRGLATTAVSALAIAGLPLFASSASAVNGDVITVASVGPARDGGELGSLIVLETKGLTQTEVNTALGDGPVGTEDSSLKVIAQDLTSDPTTALQTIGQVEFVSFVADADDASKFGKNDGFDEVTVRVTVDTRTTGDIAKFAIYADDNDDNDVDSSEAATNVEVQTSGAPASLAATPTFQSAPVGADSGDYVVTLQDSAGRTTQLTGTEVIEFDQLSGPAGGTADFTPDGPITAAGVGNDGKFSFVASGNVAGLYRLQPGAFSAAGAATPLASTIVNLDVNGATADNDSIDAEEINLVTGADDRDGFGKTTDAAQVRTDQTSITFQIDDARVQTAGAGTPDTADDVFVDQANRVVSLTATSAEVTFGGQTSQTQTVTLNAQGQGSVTFTVDAASIADGDSFTVDGASLVSPFVVNYEAAEVADGDADQTTYLSAFDGTVNPVFTVVDQYGNPVQGVFVSYELDGGANDTAGAESARVETNEAGQATFSITDEDASATNRLADTIIFRVYDGRISTNELTAASDSGSKIEYSADGQGADFLLTVDGQTPGSLAYDPTIVPLTDGIGESNAERGTLNIVGGTTGAAATVTVDGGARILANNNELDDATTSKTGLVGDTYQIVGTTEGVVNVTVTSGGKTQTATLTVEAPENNAATARNIELEGPEGGVAGDVVEFTATITDAFGNPVTGFDDNNIDARITGPGNDQGASGDSDVNGEITYSVEITQGASNPVTLRLEADGAQFGADANELTDATPATAAPGLTASVDTASATVEVVDIEALEQALADAQAVLADRQAELAAASADLDVAQAQLAIAQAEVDRLQERKQNLRQKLNKAKRNDNMQKAKTTRKKLRAVKRQLNDARDAVVVAQTRVDGQQTVVDLREQAVTAAEEAVAQAQADLDEAQN
jgi:hypothetical protein